MIKDDVRRNLAKKALEMRKMAYTPYSHFKVTVPYTPAAILKMRLLHRETAQSALQFLKRSVKEKGNSVPSPLPEERRTAVNRTIVLPAVYAGRL